MMFHRIKHMYCSERKTMREIGKLLGISKAKVGKILKDGGAKIIRSNCDIPPKEQLIKLYNEEMLTLKQIGSFYNVGRKAVKKWFKTYNISTITNAQRKYYHLRKVPFTQKQKEFLIGTLLGDGSLSKSGNFKRLTMGHNIKQLDYLLWKKEIFANLTNNIYKQIQTKRNSTIIHCPTVGHQDFNFFYNLFYNNGKKVIKKELKNYLTPFAMAVWYMDDGSKKPYCMKISTEGFTKEENEILQQIILDNFDIRCKVCEYNNRDKKYYYLSFNKRNSIKLCSLINEYIIDSMKYKIPFLND